MFDFTENTRSNEVVTSYFINTTIDLNGGSYVPRENIVLKSNKTEGAWETLIDRVIEVKAWDKLDVTITSINLPYSLTQDEVVDSELDALLNKHSTPLFEKKAHYRRADVFCYVNCTISSSKYIDGELHGSIVVRQDAPRNVLSAMLAFSKVDAMPDISVTSVVNPRVREEVTLKELDF